MLIGNLFLFLLLGGCSPCGWPLGCKDGEACIDGKCRVPAEDLLLAAARAAGQVEPPAPKKGATYSCYMD